MSVKYYKLRVWGQKWKKLNREWKSWILFVGQTHVFAWRDRSNCQASWGWSILEALTGFDIKCYCHALTCLSPVSVFPFPFPLGILSFSWSENSSGSYESDNPYFKMNDGSFPRDKWTFRLAFNGGTLLGFLKFILVLIIPSVSQESRVGRRPVNGKFFFFCFLSLICQSVHCTFGFWFCFHLFPLSIFSMPFFFLWFFPHPCFLLDLVLVILKDIQGRAIAKREEKRDHHCFLFWGHSSKMMVH